MSKWTKEELESMLEDVVNKLDLSDEMIKTHGPMGTSPAALVGMVVDNLKKEIFVLKSGFKTSATPSSGKQ